MSNPKSKSLPSIFSMFFIMLAVYCLDIFLFESDLTVWGDTIYSGILGISVLFLYLQASKMKLNTIGISKSTQKKIFGLVGGVIIFAIPFFAVLIAECVSNQAFSIEFSPPSLLFIKDASENFPPVLAVVIYIFSVFVSIFFEELFFRGLMLKKLKKASNFWKANVIQAFFYMIFGLLVTLRNTANGYYENSHIKTILITVASCVAFELISAIKGGLMSRVTGATYVAIVDHFLFVFFSNSLFAGERYSSIFIMLRMLAVQAVSFVIVLVYYKLTVKVISANKAKKEEIRKANRQKREEKRKEQQKNNKLTDKMDGVEAISPSRFKAITVDKEIYSDDAEYVHLSEKEIDEFLADLSEKMYSREDVKKRTDDISDDFDTDTFLKHYKNYDSIAQRHRHRRRHREDTEISAKNKPQERVRKKSEKANPPKKTLWQILTYIGAVDESSSNDLI